MTTPTVPRQPGVARSTVTCTERSSRARQASTSSLNASSSGVRVPMTISTVAEAVALRDDLGDHGPKRCQADASGDDDEVAACARCPAPSPTRTDREGRAVADLERAEGARDGADVADGVRDRCRPRPGFALIEMATSPTANAYSMLN